MKKLLLLSLISLFVACDPAPLTIKRVKAYAPHKVGAEVYIKPDSTKAVVCEIHPHFANMCGCGDDTTYTFYYTIRTKTGREIIKSELIY